MAALSLAVGDSSRDVLGNVKRVAKALLQEASDDALRAEEEDKARSLDDLISERNRLRLERIQLISDIQLREGLTAEPLSDSEINGEFSIVEKEQQIEELEEKLLSIKLQYLQDKKLFECLHQHDFFMKQLFTEQNALGMSEKSTQRHSHQQTELASELHYHVSGLEKVKSELLQVRKDLMAARVQCREMMTKLEDMKFEDDDLATTETQDQDSQLDRTQQSLRKSRAEVALLRHTLLCLIAGSNVDWSQDNELCDLVIKLGQQRHWT